MRYLKTRKDKIKFARGIVQAIILLVIIVILFSVNFNFKQYKHYSLGDVEYAPPEQGFIALSYFAVDREGTNTMISTERLEEHFKALQKNGYVTLKQADVINYYLKNQKLPQKSMLLMFEDGRRDTAIFASNILEKFNYHGTVLSYADQLQNKDPKFLDAKDLLKLKKTTFWELGTNGYRLTYINAFDRYNNFLGELNRDEYAALNKYMKRDYNHYLMDFIRGQDKIPRESYSQMQNRIETDYFLMDEVYNEKLNEMPQTYVLMHSNTGQFGTNKNVSAINESLIKKYFVINFNREGYALNDKDTNIYDLTRVQPQAYWYPNHLLMKIKSDTNEKLIFVDGDPDIKKDWDVLAGAGEFRKSKIILTSEPEGKGLIRLNTGKYQDLALQTTLRGNVLGNQRVYLRADETLGDYLAVVISNNTLRVLENDQEIFSLDLNKHDGIEFQTLAENQWEALTSAQELYDKNIKKLKIPTKMEPQQLPADLTDTPRAEDAEEYIPEIQVHDLGNRKVDISLKGNKLAINIDDKSAVENLTVSNTKAGYIYLASAWQEYGYSQRNLADNIYDGVFDDLIITDPLDQEAIFYNNISEGKEWLGEKISQGWNSILNWFIKNL